MSNDGKLPDIVERLLTYIPLASYDGVVLAHIAIFKEAAAKITRLRSHAGWHEAIEEAAKVVEEMPMSSSDRADLLAMLLIKQCAVDRIRSLSPPAASPWRDISSAPKDGTDILWCTDRGEYMRKRHLYEVIRWPTYKECFEEGFWQPLPSPPAGDVSRALLAASDLPPPPDVLGDPLGHGSSQGGKR